MRRRQALLLVGLVMAFVSTTKADGDHGLRVTLLTPIMAAPGTLHISMIVERRDAHRALIVEADAMSFYRSSVIALDGADAPRKHAIRYKGLPEGTYAIRVSLIGTQGVLRVDDKLARVLGGPGGVN